MDKDEIKISVNNVLNLLCTLAIGVLLICTFTTYWRYNGRVASIHDLIWVPKKNAELISWLEEKCGRELIFNEYGYGTVFLSAAGVIGGIICAFKILGNNNGIFYAAYGISGIITYLYIDFYRIGTTWRFQLILYCAVAAMGVIQIIMRYAVKKDLSVKGSCRAVSRVFITVLSAFLAVMCVISAIRGINHEKQIIQNRETINKVTAENTNYMVIKNTQLKIAENAIDDESANNASFLAEKVSSGEIAVANKEKTLETLAIIRKKAVTEENKQQIKDVLAQLEKSVLTELSDYMEKVRVTVEEKPEYDPDSEPDSSAGDDENTITSSKQG